MKNFVVKSKDNKWYVSGDNQKETSFCKCRDEAKIFDDIDSMFLVSALNRNHLLNKEWIQEELFFKKVPVVEKGNKEYGK